MGILDRYLTYLLSLPNIGSKSILDIYNDTDGKGFKLIKYWEKVFPIALRLEYPPAVLFVYGDTALLSKPKLAIAGSRGITGISRKFLRDISTYISKKDIVLLHGAARGVDRYASSIIDLECIAVYPVFPKNIRRADGELLISEFPSAKPVRKGLFLLRNRLLVALSEYVLIVQAGKNSGSYYTGLKALENKKKVFVYLPNSTFEYEGCRILRKQGATAVKSAQEFICQFDKLV